MKPARKEYVIMTNKIINCPFCGDGVVEEQLEPEIKLVALNGTLINEEVGQAPRLKCACGHVLILLKAS